MYWLPLVVPIILGFIAFMAIASEEADIFGAILAGIFGAVVVAWLEAGVGGAISAFIPVTVTPVHAETQTSIVWLADLHPRSDVEGRSALGFGSIHGGDGYGYDYPIGPNRYRHNFLADYNDVQIVTDRQIGKGAYLERFRRSSDYTVCQDIPGWQHDVLRHFVPWDADCTYSWFSKPPETIEWYEFHVPPNAVGQYYSLER